MKTKRGKLDRRSLATLDGVEFLGIHQNETNEEDEPDKPSSAKKAKGRRSIGGKVEKRKSSKFSKLSLKTLFSSNKSSEPSGETDAPDNISRSSKRSRRLSMHSTTSSKAADQSTKQEKEQRDELNRTRDAGHTPKNHRVNPVNPQIVIDLIQLEPDTKTQPSPKKPKNTAALGNASKKPSEDEKKESKKKSKREPWRRRTIGFFCGIRRKDPTSTGSNSPFENRMKENFPFPVRRSPRISTSTPIGVTEAIARVDSLVLSGDTPAAGGPARAAAGKQYPTPDPFTSQGDRLVTRGRHVSETKPRGRQNSLLNAMAESQLVTMDINGSMHVGYSPPLESSDQNTHDHSILSNLSKYKIKPETASTPTGHGNVTTRRRKLNVSQVSDKSATTFDKSLNLSDISAINQSSWLEKSLSRDEPAKVTRSKSQKKVTMETEKVEVIKKGRRSVSLRRKLSSIRKKDEEKPLVANSNRLDAGHTPRVHRKKEKAIDERLI